MAKMGITNCSKMQDRVINQTERYKILTKKPKGGSPPITAVFKPLVLQEMAADNSLALQI